MLTWLSNPFNALLVVTLVGVVLGWKRIQRLRAEWQVFQAWRYQYRGHNDQISQAIEPTLPQPVAPHQQPASELVIEHPVDGSAWYRAPLHAFPSPITVDFKTLATDSVRGVPQALYKTPDSLWYTIEYIRQYADKPYSFSLGWRINPLDGRRHLVVGSFLNDIYDILLTAIKRGGKDNAIMNILFPLMLMHAPTELQIAIIDGKRIDYSQWGNLAHVWHVANRAEDVPAAMELISAEREDRINWLNSLGRSRWEEVPTQERRPLLVVMISEIRILMNQLSVSEVEKWLSAEMSVVGALGIRILVASQNTSGMGKEWRSLFEFFMAGTQPSLDEVKPNTGKSVSQIQDLGAVAPNNLPDVGTAPGVFTLVQGNKATNVRTSYISDDQRAYWLAILPTIDPEHLAEREAHKARIIKELFEMRLKTEVQQENLKVGVYTPQSTKEVRPTLSAPGRTPPRSDPYDRDQLAMLLASRTYKQLPSEPMFQQAVVAEIKAGNSQAEVCRILWQTSGTPNGSRQEAVAEALRLHKQGQAQDEAFLLQELFQAA